MFLPISSNTLKLLYMALIGLWQMFAGIFPSPLYSDHPPPPPPPVVEAQRALTRDKAGGQLITGEVIMSRLLRAIDFTCRVCTM